MSLMRIGTRRVCTALSSLTVREIVRIMDEDDVGSVVVVHGKTPIGIVTDRDVVRRLVRKKLNPDVARVEEIMSTKLATIGEHDTPMRAAALMRERGVRRLPIVDAAGDLLGILTFDDLLVHFGREIGELAETLAPLPEGHLGG
jgi:CBS domain-containing protein